MISNIDLGEVLETLEKNIFVASRWFELGLCLGLYVTTLDTIRYDFKYSSRRLEECLAKWLERSDNVDQFGAPTWTSLVSALEKIGEMAVANSIRMEKIKFHQNCKQA